MLATATIEDLKVADMYALDKELTKLVPRILRV